MKKIYLFCSAGMSTSMLASSMQKAAGDHNLDIEVKAYSEKVVNEIVETENPDVIMLGPQVKYLFDNFSKRFGSARPVVQIKAEDYALANGPAVLKQAIVALKSFEQK